VVNWYRHVVFRFRYNLQKYQHELLRSEGKSDLEKSEFTRFKYWRIGLALVVLGSIADLTALSFAPQSLIAPLGSLTLVSNIIFAPVLLKERVSWVPDVVATVVIAIGSGVAVAFGEHSNRVYEV
jgi:hypothetical protein